ncbi:hypothetical protein [Dokdonella sp.]|uniref:hypothetical protein n=1 Tax=Dokdonella sp. TaxID=2291710 RepID=UPI0031CB7457|nr:hypothetical protein [Dokdonella sp.]
MIDFQPGLIFRLLLRTLPFFALRLAVYLGITLAYVVGVGLGSGIGLLFGKVAGASGGGMFWGALVGFALVSGILYWVREYLLYLVKAGHIAVLVELLEGREVPDGKGQIAHARQIVTARFKESSVLFGLDVLIKGILRVFNRVVASIAGFLPIPGLDGLLKIVDAIVRTSLTFLDEVILAQIIRQKSTNPWATARDSVVLYAQNYKGLFRNAVVLTFMVWGMTLLIFLLVLGPVAGLVALAPGIAGIWTFVLALVLALSLKAALVDPFAMAALMQAYAKLTDGQVPNPEWIARLDKMSGKFRTLTKRAEEQPVAAPAALPADAVARD